MGRLFCLVVLFLISLTPLRAHVCGPDGPCPVASGYYMVRVPEGWDGRSALPMLMHFHGYRETAGGMMAWADLVAFAKRHGILLVFPQGEGDTWSHPGSPAKNRDEFVFVDQVMADVTRRWPLDRTRLLVSGFSQGAAMVWNLACFRGAQFSGFLAIAGTFWRPQPETCPSGAQALIQIHGVADKTVPLEGRPIRGGAFHQGDVFRAMAMMRAANACPATASRAHRDGALACERMDGCALGKTLDFCFHPGGHDFDPSWLDFAWARLFAR